MNYLLGTDIGTSGTKTILTDLKGNVIAQDLQETDVLTPQPLWAEHTRRQHRLGSRDIGRSYQLELRLDIDGLSRVGTSCQHDSRKYHGEQYM